jgi:AraC family transcriptional regulator
MKAETRSFSPFHFHRVFRGMIDDPRIEIAATCGVHFDPRGAVPAFAPRDSGGSTMKVEIKEKPALRVAAVRHTGPYNQIPVAFEQLGALAGPAGLIRPGAAMIAMYYDDPESTPQDRLRSDAALSVAEGVQLPSGLEERRLPSGRYACTVHVGPYEQLGDTWARFMGEWLPASGHRVGDGVSYEQYLDDPSRTPKHERRTELCIPLA